MNDPLPNYFLLINLICLFSILSLLLHSYFHCFASSANNITTIFKKNKGKENKFENKSKNKSQKVSFIWIKEAGNRVVVKKTCRAC